MTQLLWYRHSSAVQKHNEYELSENKFLLSEFMNLNTNWRLNCSLHILNTKFSTFEARNDLFNNSPL